MSCHSWARGRTYHTRLRLSPYNHPMFPKLAPAIAHMSQDSDCNDIGS